MSSRSDAAQSRTEPDPGAVDETAPLPEPPPPPPPVLGTYEATYGIWRDGAYLPPGSLFHAYPSDPRVLAGQARLIRDEPTPEQAAAIADAVKS